MKSVCFSLLLLVVACSQAIGITQTGGSGVQLVRVGTEQVYFTHNGRPLLSFGGLSDFIFYAAEDAYDYELWADWAAENGINHVRAYPPMSWKYIEKFAQDNGGSPDNVLFPYEETGPGNRQFDLTRFNDAYWQRFRRQVKYLESKGIIVHLLMWNGWQLRAGDTVSGEQTEINWSGHFFNPGNNANPFTDHLGGNLDNRFKIYHCVADGKTGLVNAQKAWFRKLVEVTADLDNVYYDLVHEMAEHYRDWTKTKSWVEEMALTVRSRWAELQPNRPVVIGMDTGGLDESQRDWIFTRPYFDVLIYGKAHKIDNAKQWRIRYRKPYIPQESWDDNGIKYSYLHPQQRIHTRKYMWKFMMARCQQMDLYMKKRPSLSRNLPKYPHNYDPRQRNKFEDDAVVLRQFWNQLIDYPNLWFNGSIQSGPGSHKYVLSSGKEAVAYCSSATAKENISYNAQTIKLRGLALADGSYKAEIINPAIGIVQTQAVSANTGAVDINLPAFTDDIAVHIYKKASDQITDDEYKVYSDVVQQLTALPEGKDTVVVRETTTLGMREEFDEQRSKLYLKKNFGGKVSDDLIREFGAVNAKPGTLQNKFSDSLNTVLISKAEEDRIFNPIDGAWRRFYLKYPKSTGIIELSRVAFDTSKRKALLYYGAIFDYGKGGIGYYVLLERINDRWVIEKKVMSWIA